MSTDGPVKILATAGLVTSTVAALPSALRLFEHPSLHNASWLLPLGLFVPSFLYALRDRFPLSKRRVALGLESGAAIAFAALARGGFGAGLMAVVAGQAPFLIGMRASMLLVGAQTIALALVVGQRQSSLDALVVSGGYLGFQLFALGAAYLAEREAKARAELGRANAELLATREIFADVTRTAERLRIARDLHDAIGHHLTALRLQLEVAKNTTSGARERALATSSDVAKELLDEVREVVSAMREEEPIDLSRALARLAHGMPKPRVVISIDASVSIVEPSVALAIFRFAEEAITNAARHAGAENVWVTITCEDESVTVSARDDGTLRGGIREGNGLKGLRERLMSLGGTFEIEALRGKGVALRGLVPLRGGPT